MKKILIFLIIISFFIGCTSKDKIIKYDSSKIEQKANKKWSKL